MLTFLCIFLCVYFAPSVIALINRPMLLSQIFLTNLFLGWSVVFWVFSFRMAMGWDNAVKTPEKQQS